MEMKVELCRKGHVQCFYVPVAKVRRGKCPACASPTMADCSSCGVPIGRRVGCQFVSYVWEQDLRVPRRCAGCARAFPWATGKDRPAEALGDARAWARRHLAFKAAHAARTASGFAAGLASAACVLAGRASGPAASMEANGDGGYRITVASSGVRASMELVESGWICDCPDFGGDAARCGHVWTAVILGRARPLARRLGLSGEIRGHVEKKTATAAAVERAVGGAISDPARFEEAARARIDSAWAQCLEWERSSNMDIRLAADMAEGDPGQAMYHAQQAMEKQIKALRLYCAAFDDGFSLRKLGHKIFVLEHDREFAGLLDRHRLELKEMTMGVHHARSKSKLLGYMGDTPSLVAYGIDIDEASAPLEMENLTLERHYEYLRGSLSPMSYRPGELRCPTREYVSVAQWGRLDYRGGAERFALQWDVDATKILNEFASGAWKWRYYALCVHEDARYPSGFDPVYRQNADIVKKWVFEAGYMTAHLQNQVRAYYAIHTYTEGDHLSRRMGTVRDLSWYKSQLWPDLQ